MEKIKEKTGMKWYIVIVLLWLVYAYFYMTTPTTSNQFEISEQVMMIIRLSIIAPYLVIWVAGVYGALGVSRYAHNIATTIDGKAFHSIAKGLWFLVASMIITALVSTVQTWIRAADGISEQVINLTIFQNYVYVFVPIFGYWLLYTGTRQLLSTIKETTLSKGVQVATLVSWVLFGALYVFFVFTNESRQVSTDSSIPATYYVPDMVIAITIVAPIVGGWLLGSFASVYISHFKKYTDGIIYKQALKSLSLGIIFVISGSITLHAILSLGNERLLSLGLGLILIIIYLLFILWTIGYIYIAKGAQKLKEIEAIE